MDWGKAKNILIIALVITNIILITANIMKEDAFEEPDATALSGYLEDKNIILQTAMPKRQKPMAALTVEYDKLDEKTIENTIKKQKPARNASATKKEYIALAGAFIKRCNLFTETTEFDKFEKIDDAAVVTYKNVFEGIAVEDSYITCTIKKGEIVDLERYWLRPVKFEKLKKDPISAREALIKFASDNGGKDKIEIEDMTLVYWLDPNAFNTATAVRDTVLPAWKIVYNGGEVKHIPAFK